MLFKKEYCNRHFICRNEIKTSFSESVHDPSTNRSTKIIGLGTSEIQIAKNILLHESGNADESGRVSSIKTNGSRKEQRLESMAGDVRFPISAFPSMS